MAAKSSIIPILRQFSLKYASRQKVPARLFTACAGQMQSVNGSKWVCSANVLPRMFGAGNFQLRNASSDGKSNARSRKPVSEEEDDEEDSDDEEDLEVDEDLEDFEDDDSKGSIDDSQSEED